MLRKAIWALGIALLLALPAAVQAQDYLDVYIVKVKPEKIAEFNALAKKVAQANRHNNGDYWLASEIMYGEGDTFVFTSARQDYAEIEKSFESFMGALNKAFGKDGSEKIMHDWESNLVSSRSELRRRRPDLSWKAPADPAATAQLVGGSRVLRTTTVHVRPGHTAEFEALLKELKAAGEKAENVQTVLVSQAIEGSKGTTYYVTSLRSSMGGFDKNPTLREILGEDGYNRFLKVSAESVVGTESAIYRFSPELSNPPEQILAAAPDFWQPKAGAALAAEHTKKAPGTKAITPKPKQ